MNSRWKKFHARHGNKKYTPAFNSFLEAIIADSGAPLNERVWAWMIRRSWGNHSDACIDQTSGAILTQADSAREFGLFDKAGDPDRRTVNRVFLEFERRGYVHFEGQEIRPVDEPTFALSSLNVANGCDISTEITTVKAFVEQVWAANHPVEYKEYQNLKQELQKLDLAILQEWKAFREMSQTGATFEAGPVANGSVELSPTEPTPGAPILIGLNNPKQSSAAAAFSSFVEADGAEQQNEPPPPASPDATPEKAVVKVTAALAQFEQPDRETVLELIQACSEADTEATADEIVVLIETKGRRWRGPGLAFFLRTVPSCFPLHRNVSHPHPSPPPDEGTHAEALENMLLEWPDHPQADAWRAELETLRKPAESEERAKAQKAGQG